jgi:hypothetical protein
MDPARLSELARWTTEAGLAGTSETALLDGFCRRAVAAGLPLARAMVIIDTLHPVHEGRVARWRREGDESHTELIEYGPTDEGEAAENWRRSPFFRLLETGGSRLRIRLAAGEAAEFAGVVAMQQGMTDYLAMITRFAADGVIGEMDCVYSSWTTDHPRGFDDAQLEALIIAGKHSSAPYTSYRAFFHGLGGNRTISGCLSNGRPCAESGDSNEAVEHSGLGPYQPFGRPGRGLPDPPLRRRRRENPHASGLMR